MFLTHATNFQRSQYTIFRWICQFWCFEKTLQITVRDYLLLALLRKKCSNEQMLFTNTVFSFFLSNHELNYICRFWNSLAIHQYYTSQEYIYHIIASTLLNLTFWLIKSISTFWIIKFSLHLNQQKFFFSHFNSVKTLSEKFKKNILNEFFVFQKFNFLKKKIQKYSWFHQNCHKKKRIRKTSSSFSIFIEIKNEKISNWFFFSNFFFRCVFQFFFFVRQSLTVYFV